MTRRTGNARLLDSEPFDIGPADAAALGVSDGEPIELVSRHGRAVMPVRVTDEVEPGQVFASFHFPTAGVNALTSSLADEVTGCPEYKVTAVRLRLLDDRRDCEDQGPSSRG